MGNLFTIRHTSIPRSARAGARASPGASSRGPHTLPADVFARVQKFQQKRISEMLHFGAKADEFLAKDLLPRTETPTDLEAAVLEKLTENPRTSRKELATALAVGTTTVSKILKSLSQSGRIRRIGSARGGYWQISQ